MSLSSRTLARYSSNLDSSFKSPQWMATSACWKGLTSDRNSILWVSERMRNRVLTETECLVNSMMLRFRLEGRIMATRMCDWIA